jgi:hypothetical protein
MALSHPYSYSNHTKGGQETRGNLRFNVNFFALKRYEAIF